MSTEEELRQEIIVMTAAEKQDDWLALCICYRKVADAALQLILSEGDA